MIDFTMQEKIEILEANGYEVKLETRSFWRSVYHNDTESWDAEIYAVFKDGKEVNEYRANNVSKDYYIDDVFDQIYKKKITNLLCN